MVLRAGVKLMLYMVLTVYISSYTVCYGTRLVQSAPFAAGFVRFATRAESASLLCSARNGSCVFLKISRAVFYGEVLIDGRW